MRRNSTLPIITDENSDNVFLRFIEMDSNSIVKNSSVWLDAHARQVDESSTWHWIDGRSSGMVHLACITRSQAVTRIADRTASQQTI